MAYDTKAQEFAYGFYARGWSRERSLAEIRKQYPGFSGSTWDEWVKKLDWPARRAAADAKLREFDDLCRDTARLLLMELNEIRERLVGQIRNAKEPDTQIVYAYNSISKQIAELARTHLEDRDGQRVTMEVLRRAFDKFMEELRGIDGLARPLEANAEAIGQAVARIADEFGVEA
ncbi:MAG: hypothetical protein ACE15B_19420 [Bryobacteraceae bacterium]